MNVMTLGIAVLVAGVASFLALVLYASRRLSFGQPKGEGYAPGWQVRCPACGLTVDAGKAGLVRIWAAGRERRFGRCSHCNASRWLIIERVSDPQAGDSEPEHNRTG